MFHQHYNLGMSSISEIYYPCSKNLLIVQNFSIIFDELPRASGSRQTTFLAPIKQHKNYKDLHLHQYQEFFYSVSHISKKGFHFKIKHDSCLNKNLVSQWYLNKYLYHFARAFFKVCILCFFI